MLWAASAEALVCGNNCSEGWSKYSISSVHNSLVSAGQPRFTKEINNTRFQSSAYTSMYDTGNGTAILLYNLASPGVCPYNASAPGCKQAVGTSSLWALKISLAEDPRGSPSDAEGGRLVKTDDESTPKDPWPMCRPNVDSHGVPGWRGYKLAWGISPSGFGAESREDLHRFWSITPPNNTDTLYPVGPDHRHPAMYRSWPSNASNFRWDTSSNALVLGNLTRQVEAVRDSLQGTMPRDYAGLAALDYESPRPLWDTYLNEWEPVQEVYRQRVRALVAAAHPHWSPQQVENTSRHSFEGALRTWMLATLKTVRQHAPRAQVGFYGFPERYTDLPFCETAERRRLSDQLAWMWNASSAIFPSVYLLYEGGVEVPVEFNAEYVRSNVAEAVRVADEQQPVWAYSMFYYHTSRLHKESAQHNVSGQGHGDLRTEFLAAYQAGAVGSVVWGNDADRGAPQRSEVWAAQLHAVAKDFFSEQCNCSASVCRGMGKCLFDRSSDQQFCQPFKSDDQESTGSAPRPSSAAPPPTVLRVQHPHGSAEGLFGVNWEGVVKGTSYLNVTGSPTVPGWVDRSAPLLSPKLVLGLQMLRVRSLRYPGGAPSNYFNWTNSSFTLPSRCNDKPGPGGCEIYYPTQVLADAHFPRRALGWRSFSKLLAAVGGNVSGVWCLDIVNQSPAEAAGVLRALQADHRSSGRQGQQLRVELGNEIYDFHAFLQMFPNASTYLAWVAPLLQARTSDTGLAVPVPPCPSFYNEACWGGPATLLAAWYSNISTASNEAAVGFQAVTAHHYRPTVHEINCTLTGGCMYSAGAHQQSAAAATAFGPADFASVMITYPSVTLAAAAKAWRRDFPGKPLLITEFEMQWPTNCDGPAADTSAAGRFVCGAVDSGAHAVFYAAAIVAAIDSAGVIGSINHHALGSGEPGWGLMDLSSPDGVGYNSVAQMISHLSAIAENAAAHRVNVSGGATLGPLVVDSQGPNLPALQAAALSTAGMMRVLVVNRAHVPIECELELPASSTRRLEGRRAVTGRLITYSAADPGGWHVLSKADWALPLPWAGPMRPSTTPLQLPRATSQSRGGRRRDRFVGLAMPPLSLSIIELAMLPS
eukprot:SAG22_NODE_329_length_12249_cov_27.341646_3_plen_1098_part_00